MLAHNDRSLWYFAHALCSPTPLKILLKLFSPDSDQPLLARFLCSSARQILINLRSPDFDHDLLARFRSTTGPPDPEQPCSSDIDQPLLELSNLSELLEDAFPLKLGGNASSKV